MADLTDEAKAEIADAVRIVREDRQFSMLQKLSGSKESATPPDPSKGNPPPPKDPATEPPSPKKAGLWWGDRAE